MDKDFQKLSLIATRLCEKLKEVHDSKEYQGVWSMFMIHGGKYGGPQYGKELKELENYLEINNGLE